MIITVATGRYTFLCGVRLLRRGQHSYRVCPDITLPNPRGSFANGLHQASYPREAAVRWDR